MFPRSLEDKELKKAVDVTYSVGLILIISCPLLLLAVRCPRDHQLNYSCKQVKKGLRGRFCLLARCRLCQHFVFIKLRTGPSFSPSLPPVLSTKGPLWWDRADTGVRLSSPGVGTVAVAPTATSCLGDPEQGPFLPCTLVVSSLRETTLPHTGCQKWGTHVNAHFKRAQSFDYEPSVASLLSLFRAEHLPEHCRTWKPCHLRSFAPFLDKHSLATLSA